MEIEEVENLSKTLEDISHRINNRCEFKSEKMSITTLLIGSLLKNMDITNDEKSRILIHLCEKYIEGEM